MPSKTSLLPALRIRLLAALSLTLAVCLVAPSAALAETVFVDPGHGGPYRNYYANGIREKDANLWIGLALRDQLRALGYGVAMSRTTDRAVELGDIPTWNWNSTYSRWDFARDGKTGGDPPKDDLQGRVDLANSSGADIFISVHQNAATGGARGTETYGTRDNAIEAKLASYVQYEVVAEVGTVNRGVKEMDFYVIKWANMPAVLIECAFYDNALDAELLKSSWYRYKFAKGIARGIRRFLESEPFTPVYKRISGPDRFGTAAAIAREGWPATSSAVLVANGFDWPDALAAAPLSDKLDAPLLLATTQTVPASTVAELRRLKPREVVVLGGEAAVSASAVAQACESAGLTETTVRRIAGEDRFETASKIASEVGVPADGRVVVVSGEKSPDALTASAFAGRFGTPILLSRASGLPSATSSFIAGNAGRVRSTVVVGGPTALPESTLATLPARRRIYGEDRYMTNLAMMKTYWPTGYLGMYVATGTRFADALTVAPLAARNGRPIVLVRPRSLSAYQRQFVENNAWRITNFTMVGGPGAVPYLMDWQLNKAYN